MENKHKNPKEFIKEFKKSGLFTPQMLSVINSGEIEDINEKKLKEFSINPDLEGYYKNSQFLELNQKINEEIKKRVGALYSLVPNSEIEEFNYITNASLESYEIKKLLLLTLSDKFQKEVKDLRKKYEILKEGFENDKEYDKWNKSISITLVKQLLEDSKKLFYNYQLKLSAGLGLNYIIRKSDFQLLIKCVKINPILTSVSFEKFQKQLRNPYSPLSNYSYLIAITEPVTKEKLISYINENWKEIKQEMEEYFGQFPLSQNLKRDFLIYSYHKASKNIQEIRGILTQYGFTNISKHQVKHTIARLKKRIKKLEDGATK